MYLSKLPIDSCPPTFFKATMAGTGTVKVHNVSLKASEQDISEFFSFSGEIVHVELKRLVPISSP
jgi:hypothetical protein